MTREQKKFVSALNLFNKARDVYAELEKGITGMVSVNFSPSVKEGVPYTAYVHLRKETLLDLAEALGAEVAHRDENWMYNGKQYTNHYLEFDYNGLNVFAIDYDNYEEA